MNKSTVRFHAFLFVLLTALFLTSAVGAAVGLSVAQSSFSSAEYVLVTVTFSNPNKNTVRVLKWFTPAEEVEEPLFAVTRNGDPVT